MQPTLDTITSNLGIFVGLEKSSTELFNFLTDLVLVSYRLVSFEKFM